MTIANCQLTINPKKYSKVENSLKQYIELYQADPEVVSRGSAGALNDARAAALEALVGTWLPTTKTPDYEKTSINEMFAPDYGMNLQRVAMPVDIAASFKCDVPNMSTLQAYVVGDTFVPSARLAANLPEGVLFCSLKEAAKNRPELVAKYYNTIAPASEPGVALNTLFAQDGVFLYVPDGVELDKPLQLVNIFSAPIPMAAFRRVLIVLGRGAHAQLLVCDHTQDTEHAYLSSQVVEIALGDGARLEYCEMEESSEKTSRFSQLFADQQRDSYLNLTGVTLTCGTTRNNYVVSLSGEHAEARLAGMAVNDEHRHVDNCTNVRHVAPRCHSNQLFKYVLDGSSTGAFEGEILVTPTARFTEAYQTNRNILASREAKMHTTPRLLIYDDDVKCSHGATTGQLDSEALFYMQTRGIPLTEARTMLMQAFMVDVIDSVGIEGLRDRLRHLTERRFSGEDFCGSCAMKK